MLVEMVITQPTPVPTNVPPWPLADEETDMRDICLGMLFFIQIFGKKKKTIFF